MESERKERPRFSGRSFKKAETAKGGYGKPMEKAVKIGKTTFSGQMRYTSRYQITDNDGNQLVSEAMIGGIAGCLDENSTVSSCRFNGNIVVYANDWDDRDFQPRIGGIVGMLYSGTQNNNTSTGSINVDNLNPDVSWWAWFVTYHHNQRAYCGQIVGNSVVNPIS